MDQVARPKLVGRCYFEPALPSFHESLDAGVRALTKATEVLRQAQEIRGGRPDAIIVLSMVGKNYRLTKDMVDRCRA